MNKRNEERVVIPTNDLVTVTKMNHIIEVQHMEKMNTKCHIKKLDKDRYVDLRTGAIEEFEHIQTRKDSYNSLRQTFKKLRYLINNNFTGKGNELHIILTYAENMTDTKRLYKDFDNFRNKLKYKFKNISSIDYLNVIEPQERGAWHCHLLLRFNDLEKIFIPNNELADLWGQGFTKIKSLKDVDNIGAYLSAYLSDVELTADNMFRAVENQNTVVIRQVDGEEKKFIKGGRLHLYPPGMNLFRRSKGIEYPEREKMKFKDIKKIVGSAKPTYEKSFVIEENDFSNTINYVQYNMKRPK